MTPGCNGRGVLGDGSPTLVLHHVRSYDTMFADRLVHILGHFAGKPTRIGQGQYNKSSCTTLLLQHPWLQRISDDRARLRASVVVEVPEEATFKVPDVAICSIPIMAGSKLAERLGCSPKCPVGSFLVPNADGSSSSAKAILMHEQSAHNFLKFKFSPNGSDAMVSVSSSDGNRNASVDVKLGVHPDSRTVLKNAKQPVMLDELATGKKFRKKGLTIDLCLSPKDINLAVFIAACWHMEQHSGGAVDDDGIDVFCKLMNRKRDDYDIAPTIKAADSLTGRKGFTCKDAWNFLIAAVLKKSKEQQEKEKENPENPEEADDVANEDEEIKVSAAIRSAFPHIRSGRSSISRYAAYLADRLMKELVAPKESCKFLVGKDRTESKCYDAAGELLGDLLRKSLDASKGVLSEKLRNAKRNTSIGDVVEKVRVAFADTDDVFWSALRTGRFYSKTPHRAPRGGRSEDATTGVKWVDGAGGTPRFGVCQALPLDSPIASISLLRRIVSPLANAETLSKVDEPRMIDIMSKGRICPAETPDGHDVGLKKNLALSGTLSVRVPGVHDAFSTFATTSLFAAPTTVANCLIFVDGDLLGETSMAPEDVAARFRAFRSSHQPKFWMAAPSVATSGPFEVHVRTNPGRLVMPVVNASSSIETSWDALIEKGQAFLIDASEEACVRLDWGDETTGGNTFDYKVPYPRGILGVPAALIPFSNHNQAPRLQFGASMEKQAVVPASMSTEASQSKSVTLDFCQRPLVESMSTPFLLAAGMDPKVPLGATGVNAMVLVVIDPSGYAQEDALIWNKGSLDRGILSATKCEKYEDLISSFQSLSNAALCGRAPLQSVGEIKAGDIIQPDPSNVAPLRGRVVKVERRRLPVDSNRKDDPNFVQQVQITHVLTTCAPMVGDKFTSRHGQKGVMGSREDPENLPFAEDDGMVPDVIINPHAFPSRMTEGQHIEGAVGLVAAQKGFIFREGSTIASSSPEAVAAFLIEEGFKDGGKKVFRCGRTGRRLKAMVMIEPVYYNRLTHMVENKARVRGAGGSCDPLTKQPARGRKNGGGIRLGEMEVHAIIAQGANNVLRDRLTNTAPFTATIDTESGSFLYDTVPPREFSKDNVDQGPITSTVRMPYATKLLFQEMQALGIRTVLR